MSSAIKFYKKIFGNATQLKIVKDIIDFLRAPIQSDNRNVLIPRQTLYIRTIIESLQYSSRHNQMRTPIWFHDLFGSLHDRVRLLLCIFFLSNYHRLNSVNHSHIHTQKKRENHLSLITRIKKPQRIQSNTSSKIQQQILHINLLYHPYQDELECSPSEHHPVSEEL